MEEKSTEIPVVAASEVGQAQTVIFDSGVVGPTIKFKGSLAEHFWKVGQYKVIVL